MGNTEELSGNGMIMPSNGDILEPQDDSSEGAIPRWILKKPISTGDKDPKVCAFCGEEALPESVFCPNDGRALTAALLSPTGEPLTVLFTDIEDSVQLTERYGDNIWADIVDDHNRIVRGAIASHAGFEVKSTGDGFLIVFTDPRQALIAAVDIQVRIALRVTERLNWPVSVRMGIHRGDVILRPGGDILGRTVNMAQRVLEKSGGGEIWVSEPMFKTVDGICEKKRWIDRGMRRLRGVSGRQRLYELRWKNWGLG